MCPTQAGSASAVSIDAEVLSRLPDDSISIAVLSHSQSHLHSSILAHSLRVYLYAHALGQHIDSPYVQSANLPILFAACLFHDIGTSQAHSHTNQRFEVEAADFASAFLASHQRSSTECHDVWVAIACHTSPGIAERVSPLARLVRVGVTVDFGLDDDIDGWVAQRTDTETLLPRARIEHVLADAVIAQCADDVAKKAPKGSWAWSLYSEWMREPQWSGVNKGF
nr:hypothetical protein CFP56_12941 [Quercus suber]